MRWLADPGVHSWAVSPWHLPFSTTSTGIKGTCHNVAPPVGAGAELSPSRSCSQLITDGTSPGSCQHSCLILIRSFIHLISKYLEWPFMLGKMEMLGVKQQPKMFSVGEMSGWQAMAVLLGAVVKVAQRLWCRPSQVGQGWEPLKPLQTLALLLENSLELTW